MTVGDWAKYTSEGCRSATGSGQPGGGVGTTGEGVRRAPPEPGKESLTGLTAMERFSYG